MNIRVFYYSTIPRLESCTLILSVNRKTNTALNEYLVGYCVSKFRFKPTKPTFVFNALIHRNFIATTRANTYFELSDRRNSAAFPT